MKTIAHHNPVPTLVGTVLILAALLSGASCGPELPAYSRFESLSPHGWTPEEMMIFEPWPADSLLPAGHTYEVRLCLRHRLPAPATATLIVEQESLSMPERRDTLTMTLLNSMCTPLGRGTHGLYTVEHTLTSPLTLSEGYNIAIIPLDTIYSATDIGILLLPR